MVNSFATSVLCFIFVINWSVFTLTVQGYFLLSVIKTEFNSMLLDNKIGKHPRAWLIFVCEWFSVCSFKTKATAIYFNTACIYSYNQLFRLQHTLRPFETFRCELVAHTLVTSDTQWLEGKSVWCRSVLGDLWQVFCALSPSALISLRSELRYLCGFNLNGSLLIVQIEPPPLVNKQY